MNKSYFLKLYLLLFGICLWSVWVGKELTPFKYSFPYVGDFLSKQGNWLFWPLANFDGVHYLLLAKEGYIRDLYQAFFPVYPYLTGLMVRVFGNVLFTSLLISQISFVIALISFYKLLKIDYDAKIVKKIIMLFIFFPTSFFLLGSYSESLFLALMFSFFLALRKKKYWLAALLAGIASATRFIGIFLIVPLIYEYWQRLKRKKILSDIWKIVLLSLISWSGILMYMRFLHMRYSDPFKFIHVQGAFGADRTSGKIILLYQVFYRYLKMIFTVDRTNPIYYTLSLEFMISLLFLALILIALLNKKLKINLSYLLFSIPAYILPTLTGTLSSMPRYVLVCFVGFMVLGQIKSRIVYRFIFGIFFVFLLINSILFYRGYWIA